MNNHIKQAGKVLQQISPILDNFIQQDGTPGLLNGYTGCALFYAYYYHLTGKKKYLKQVHTVMLKSIQALSEQQMMLSHCSGISGIAWSIQHLINAGFAEGDGIQDIFEEADEILGSFMDEDLRDNNYDFLHQGLGIAIYFLERLPHPTAVKYLSGVVQQLEKSAVSDAHGIRWKDRFSLTSREEQVRGQSCFNLGLAHGMPAIITILGLIHEKGIEVESTRRLIEGSLQWLLTIQNPPAEGLTSIYPPLVGEANEAINGGQSRLGWCYGDLSVAATLWNTGKRIGQPVYQQAAYTIFEYSIHQRTLKNGSVHDACLCHGSAGIAHIYRRMALDNQDALLLQGADKWLQATLEMNTWQDGLAGYKFFAHPDYQNSYNLLEGITGVGLALIAAVDTQTAPAWDRCLLLS
ncbi:Lanthionine synthetase C-like protein [Chitinophaga rupis]|uniref:Lanthionine synthetase C-like protein n=1 Tax=Chitinophaga rupis TaxID=573321 RepID=A0A1H8CEZ4_9BACT|nr:lanthionine synthetase C family protein [Chitinophaga rupis]SEM93605.1 Lanthionine synthetase C-like protein [Chitinophaga rupis]